jgi:hypothetical protein
VLSFLDRCREKIEKPPRCAVAGIGTIDGTVSALCSVDVVTGAAVSITAGGCAASSLTATPER